MERRRLRLAGNSVIPQIPEAIGRAILAYEHADASSQNGAVGPCSPADLSPTSGSSK
jgi:hypothetical protein